MTKTKLPGRVLWRFQRPLSPRLAPQNYPTRGEVLLQRLPSNVQYCLQFSGVRTAAKTASDVSAQPINLKHDDTLKTTTAKWLKESDGAWTTSDVAMARTLLTRWLANRDDEELSSLAPRFTVLILRKWLNYALLKGNGDKDFMEFFYRVLWSQPSPDQAVKLLQAFHATKKTFLRPGPRAYSMVFEKLTIQADKQSTITAADEIMKQLLDQDLPSNEDADILVAQNSYLNLLAECSRHHDSDVPKKASDFLSSTKRFNEKSYAAVLKAYANSPKKPEAAIRAHSLLSNMIQRKMFSRVCFNICLQALGNDGRGQQAEDWLWRMYRYYTQDGIEEARFDHYSFLAVINAYSKSDNPEKAESILETMSFLKENEHRKIAAIRPTIEIYNAVLDAWARRKNSGDKVEELLRHMEEWYQNGDMDARPTRESYTIAIRAWGNQTINAPNRVEEITDLVRRMDELAKSGRDDLVPNNVTYATLIQTWAQSGLDEAPDNALTILRHMEKLHRQSGMSSVAPNTVAYNSVISAFARQGRFKEACDILDEMKSRSSMSGRKDLSVDFRPDAISWTTLIDGYSRNKAPDASQQVNDLLTELESLYDGSGDATLNPTARTYASAIMAHGLNGSTQNAEAIFWRMINRYQDPKIRGALPPTTLVCNALLRVWSRSNDPVAPQRAEEILRWMEREMKINRGIRKDLRPDGTTCILLLRTWERSGRRNAPERIYELQRYFWRKYPDVEF